MIRTRLKPLFAQAQGPGAADVGEVDVVAPKVLGHEVKVASGRLLGHRAHDDSGKAAAVQAARTAACTLEVELGERKGQAKRYGFVYIDADHDFKRIKKDSFYWYKKVIASNGEDLADFEA